MGKFLGYFPVIFMKKGIFLIGIVAFLFSIVTNNSYQLLDNYCIIDFLFHFQNVLMDNKWFFII